MKTEFVTGDANNTEPTFIIDGFSSGSDPERFFSGLWIYWIDKYMCKFQGSAIE